MFSITQFEKDIKIMSLHISIIEYLDAFFCKIFLRCRFSVYLCNIKSNNDEVNRMNLMKTFFKKNKKSLKYLLQMSK